MRSEYTQTPVERADYIEAMTDDERVFALSVLAGLRPLVFDEVTAYVDEARSQRARALLRAEEVTDVAATE